MTTWTERTDVSTTYSERPGVVSDYEILQNNQSVNLASNDGEDLLVHTGNFVDKKTEWSERTTS